MSVKMLSDLKTARYRLVLFFLWLPNADLAVDRVANRVRQGGHGVPEETIRRRFGAGLRNLFEYYHRLMDDFWLYDASKYPPGLIVREYLGERDVRQLELDEFITQTWGGLSNE